MDGVAKIDKDFINDFPWINFPKEWKIKMVPPFAEATVRFYVELPNGVIKSVYFDKDGKLGAYYNYWEVFQIEPRDDNRAPKRCDKNDITKLLKIIEGDILYE
jgi:hypothetical protein